MIVLFSMAAHLLNFRILYCGRLKTFVDRIISTKPFLYDYWLLYVKPFNFLIGLKCYIFYAKIFLSSLTQFVKEFSILMHMESYWVTTEFQDLVTHWKVFTDSNFKFTIYFFTRVLSFIKGTAVIIKFCKVIILLKIFSHLKLHFGLFFYNWVLFFCKSFLFQTT